MVFKHVRITLLDDAFVLMFMMLYRVCTHVRPVILTMIICVYVGDFVEGMYTCEIVLL